jgi:hypothetical protein
MFIYYSLFFILYISIEMRMNPLPVGRDAVGIVGGAVEAGQGAGEGGQVLLNKASETCQDRHIDRQIDR